MPRFAVLEHDHPAVHWDFFLEAGTVLRSWRLLAPPGPNFPVPAEPMADHRILYLTYEGPVSGGRGTVLRFDGGTFDWQVDDPDHIAVRLSGTRLVGRAMIRLGPAGWTWTFEPDPP